MIKAILSNLSNTIRGTNTFTESRAMSLLHDVDVPFEKATFGLGCFWGIDTLFGGRTGVLRTRVGYGGGKALNPTYKNIQDHTEITEVDFDPKTVSYKELLEMFWKNHNPTFKTTTQYCSLILYHSPEQKSLAEKSRDQYKQTSKAEVLTRIEPFEVFYDAEGYHQKYHLQEHSNLLSTLGFQKDDERLKTSHLATKINAYLMGMTTVEQFEAEVTSLGLEDKTIEYIRKYNVKNQGRGITC